MLVRLRRDEKIVLQWWGQVFDRAGRRAVDEHSAGAGFVDPEYVLDAMEAGK